MLSNTRPTAAELRVMRAEAAQVRAQQPLHSFHRVVIDDAPCEVHNGDCTYCAMLRARRMAVAS